MLYQQQLLVFLLITSLFSLSNGSSSSSSHHRLLAVTTNPGNEVNNRPNYENVGGRELLMMTNRRVLVKYEPDLLLAEERTRRKDPTNHLKLYEGGWNISDSHYHWSTMYTGCLFYLTGIASFGVLAFIWCCSLICLCCCKGGKTNPTANYHTFSVVSLSIFTLIAIGGAIVVYWSVEEFYATTNGALSYMRNNSDEGAGSIRKVYTYLDQAGNLSLGIGGGGGGDNHQYNLPKVTQQDIEDSYWRYSYTVQRITNDSQDHIHKIHQSVNSIRYYLLFISSAGLLIILVGFVASSRGYLVFIYILAIFGWMVVTGGLFGSGLSVSLYNEVGDTCLAMEEWVQKGPVEGTAMDELISCADVKDELRQTKMVTQQLVALIVDAINDIANGHSSSSSSSTPSFFSRRHKSDPFLPLLCNPYYADLSPRQCERGEVDFTNATQVWQNYVCKEVGAGGMTCLTQGKLTPTFYNELNKAVNISSHLHKYTPFLADLDKCTNLKTVLQHITCHYCPNISKYTRMFFIGLPIVSGAVMFSIIFWLHYAKKRKYQINDNSRPAAAQTIAATKPPAQHQEAGVP